MRKGVAFYSSRTSSFIHISILAFLIQIVPNFYKVWKSKMHFFFSSVRIFKIHYKIILKMDSRRIIKTQMKIIHFKFSLICFVPPPLSNSDVLKCCYCFCLYLLWLHFDDSHIAFLNSVLFCK